LNKIINIMEDQLISKETTELALQKGYNLEPTRYLDKYYNDFEGITQSLLQRWLREKHKILIEPTYNTHYNTFDLVVTVIGGLSYHTKTFKTYEECLELGLQEALKLIK
jgi:hypothetical protein